LSGGSGFLLESKPLDDGGPVLDDLKTSRNRMPPITNDRMRGGLDRFRKADMRRSNQSLSQ
jgi:hypothetical protein